MRQSLDPRAGPRCDDAAQEHAVGSDAVVGSGRAEIHSNDIGAVDLGRGEGVEHAVGADGMGLLDIKRDGKRTGGPNQLAGIGDQARLAFQSAAHAATDDRVDRRHDGRDDPSHGSFDRFLGQELS